jgi:hypothetical protein
MKGETPMFHNKSILATIVMLVGLLISGCDRATTTSSAASGVTVILPRDKAGKTPWRPNWETTPDKSKRAKSLLSPTVSFADPGFRGSPVPQNEREKKQELKNRGDFVQSFQSEPECFGITLMVKNPGNADFGLQVFNGIDERTGRWQWVVYRMDTLGATETGEATGAGTRMGLDATVKSVCSSIHGVVFYRGGRVE